MIDVVFSEPDGKFKSKVYGVVAKYIDKLLFRKRGAIIRDIRSLIPNWIISQPEMQDLLFNKRLGSLNAQLGLEYGTGEEAVRAIVAAATNSVALDISKVNKKTLNGGIKAKFMTSTFKELLELDEGKVTTEKGEELHWLKWLLTEGFGVIIVGYDFNFKRAGRSKGGYMSKGGSWRMPTEFVGTPENNFITRALTGKNVENDIAAVFKRHIK